MSTSHRFIAWVNGCSFASASTEAELEPQIANALPRFKERSQAIGNGRPFVLTVTFGPNQKVIHREEVTS